MLLGLISPALSLAAAEPAPIPPIAPGDAHHAIRVCSADGDVPDAALLDVRGLTTASALAAAIEQAGAQAVIIYGGDFEGQDMRPLAPLLTDACFVNTDLSKTDWRGTRISDLQFQRTKMQSIKVQGAVWPGLHAHGVSFEGADFTGANLTGMEFVSAYQGARFDDVSFKNADLTGAQFVCGITVDVWCIGGSSASFAGSNLTSANLNTIGLWDAENLRGARIDGTIVSPRNLTSLADADIAGSIVLKSELTSARLSDNALTARLTPDEARDLIAATQTSQRDVASFDCAKAASDAEVLICGEYESELRSLDRELAKAWEAAKLRSQTSLREQLRWLASRDECADRTCLAEKYRLRIAALEGAFGPQPILAPEQSITYYDDALPLPDAMRETSLYERILPVLRDASWQRITLTGREDGSVSAEGDALGANAHLCSLGIREARFNAATGWYSGVDEGGVSVKLFRVSGRKLELRYNGNGSGSVDGPWGFISCGARASFGDSFDLSAR